MPEPLHCVQSNKVDIRQEEHKDEDFGGWNICFLPRHYSSYSEYIKNFSVRNDDVWVASFIKAGTTWTQEMVWLIGNNLDYEGAKAILPVRFPYFEFDASFDNNNNSLIKGSKLTSMEIVHRMPSQRYIKTHLPFNLLPQQIQAGKRSPKIVYVARNPKDVCVSYYHHKVMVEGYSHALDTFVDEFIDDLSSTNYAPFWEHVRHFWERRHDPNVLFITFEEMRRDLRKVVLKTCAFMGKAYSNPEIDTLIHHLSFESMKNNPSVNYDEITEKLLKVQGAERKTHFMRKGKVGSWKEEMSPLSISKLDKWMEANAIEGLGW